MSMIRTTSKEGTQSAEGEKVFNQELVGAFRDHLPLMLIGPALVASLTYVLLLFQPGTYVSTTILRVDRPTARAIQAVMTTPVMADRVLSKYPGSPAGREARAKFISGNLNFAEIDSGDRPGERMYRMEVSHRNAQSAQSISSDLIDTWLETTVPVATERKTLEAELERVTLSVATYSQLIERLQREATTLLSPNSMAGELATPITALITKRDQGQATIVTLQNKLAGTARDAVIILPADLPQTAVYPAKRGTVLLAGFAAIPLLFTLVILGRYFAPGRSPRQLLSSWFGRTG